MKIPIATGKGVADGPIEIAPLDLSVMSSHPLFSKVEVELLHRTTIDLPWLPVGALWVFMWLFAAMLFTANVASRTWRQYFIATTESLDVQRNSNVLFANGLVTVLSHSLTLV
jgi:hypothetical protein